MRTLLLAVLTTTMAFSAAAQDRQPATPPPPASGTWLDFYESLTNSVILRARSEMGRSQGQPGGQIEVACVDFLDSQTNRLAAGLQVFTGGNYPHRGSAYIDYDEITPLLESLETLSKLHKDVTSLETIQASYRTRGELLVTRSAGPGAIYASVRAGRSNDLAVTLNEAGFQKFKSLVQQGKARLDAITRRR